MKYHLIVPALFALTIISSSPSLAVANGLRPTLKAERQETRETLKNERENLKATTTQSRLEFNRKRALTVNQGLVNSFDKRLENLKSYQSRIQTRLTTKAGKIGADKLSEAQAKLNSLTTLYSTYSSNLSIYKTAVDGISTSTNPKSLQSDLKAKAKVVNQDLKNIKTALVESLRLIITAK